MFLFLVKRKRFLISALFLLTSFTLSILNAVVNDGEIRQVKFHTDEQGNILDTPPYPPFSIFIFGSERYGYDLGHIMVEGAKWTIAITIIIVICRLLFSIVLGSFMDAA